MTKICIRAGHGQNSRGQGDPGCCSGALREDDITLQAALALNNTLKQVYETVIPRANDTWLDVLPNDRGYGLRKGVAMAKKAGCHVFLSIHVNAAGSVRAEGAEAIVRSGDQAAHALAKDLLEKHCAILGMKNRGLKERCADLYELRETKAMDTVLLEMGFISHEKDRQVLNRFLHDREMRIAWSEALGSIFQKHYKPQKQGK